MSLFQRTFTPLRTSTIRLSRPFTSSTIRSALSESDHASDHPDRDAKIDHHKSDSVNKAKSGDPQWKPELASNSEQGVQADKSEMSMKDMQKMGEKNAEQGKSPSGSK